MLVTISNSSINQEQCVGAGHHARKLGENEREGGRRIQQQSLINQSLINQSLINQSLINQSLINQSLINNHRLMNHSIKNAVTSSFMPWICIENRFILPLLVIQRRPTYCCCYYC